MRVLEFLEGRRVIEQFGGSFDASRAGAGLGHRLEHALLLSGEALDGLHQIRNQIGPPLVDILHLGPLLGDVDLGRHELVVDADSPADGSDQNQDDDAHDNQCSFHGPSIPPRVSLQVIPRIRLVEGLVAEREVGNDVLQQGIGQGPPVEE